MSKKILQIDTNKLPAGNGIIFVTINEAIRDFHFIENELEDWEVDGVVPIIIENGVAKLGDETARKIWIQQRK